MKVMKLCEHLGRCSVPGAYNTSAGSADPLTSRPIERIEGGHTGRTGSQPESEKWETPIRKETGNWEKTPSRTAGLPNWPGMSDISTKHSHFSVNQE